MATPFAVAALTVAAAIPAAAQPASAAGSGTPTDRTSTENEPGTTETSRLQLVMDASGSMSESAGDMSRIDAAKAALDTVIDGLPDDAEVGFRVFGSEISDESDPQACEDSVQVVDIDTGNRDELRAAVDDYEPYGWTPIGYALLEAAEDLGTEGQRTIVLVSDGEPTCDPDPCEVAADLTSRGYELKIDVVGLDLDGAAREIMQCVAAEGGGTYYDASDADSLTSTLVQLTTRAFRPFEVSGTPVEGGLSAEEAPVLTAGQYVDTFPEGSSTLSSAGPTSLYYVVERTAPGSTIHVGTTVQLSSGIGTSAIDLLTADGEECGTDSSNRISGEGFLAFQSQNIISTGVNSATADAGAPDHPCTTEDSLIVEVTGSDTVREAISGHDFELVVHEEPPVTQTDGIPPAITTAEWSELSAGDPQGEVVPGLGFSDAPVLQPGTYELSILPGEIQVVAVEADWGQQVQALLEVAPTEADVQRFGVLSGFTLEAFDPYRHQLTGRDDVDGLPDWDVELIDVDGRTYIPDIARDEDEGGETFQDGIVTAPVTYLNRTEEERVGSGVAGPHYITVAFDKGVGPGTPDDDVLIDYTLTIDTPGEAGVGEPVYADSPPAEGGESGSGDQAPSPDDEPTGTAGDDDGDEPADEDTTATAAEDDGFSISPLAAILAVLGCGLLVSGGYMVRQAFRRSASL